MKSSVVISTLTGIKYVIVKRTTEDLNVFGLSDVGSHFLVLDSVMGKLDI